MRPALDHIAVAARTLEEGAAWLQSRLGVALQPGGRHLTLGTHNMLLSLGREEYLELIAVDPDATCAPGWFGLDQFADAPRIVGWVIRQSPINAPESTVKTDVSRGDLRWKITLPLAGHMPVNGVVPMQIEWQGGQHPCDKLHDHGLRLTGLTLQSPTKMPSPVTDPRISLALGPAKISARISGQKGEVTI